MDNLRMRLNKTAKGRHTGFTLVELLVVIAIIAILSVTAYVALGGQTGKARNSRRMQDLSAIQSALEVYFVENYSVYPATDNFQSGLVPKYMQNIPTDPIPGKNYVYAADAGGNNKTYQLAAVIENDDGSYEAYVIGNGTDLINGYDGCGIVTDGGDCLPYSPTP